MEKTVCCVWCGCENPSEQETCGQCKKPLKPKENLLVDFLVAHTKDKLKGDVEDGIFEAIKNFLLSHLYSVIITVALAATAVAAVAVQDPAAHIQKVTQAPAMQQVTLPVTEPATEPGTYVLTQEDKQQISECLEVFADWMRITRMIGDDYEYLDYLISEELEIALGYDSYVDMYADLVEGDIYSYNYCEYGQILFEESTWSTEPLTQNAQQLVDMGYTIATVYAEHHFYGRLTGMSNAPTELIGSPRYLMTFTIENGSWLLVEQINVTDRLEERQDAFL